MLLLNNSLGILPISNFIDCRENMSNEDLYRKILDEECRDIILYGNVKEKEDQLKWLTPLLITEAFFISVITSINATPNVTNNRLIIPINFYDFRKKSDFLSSLTAKDIVVLIEEDSSKLIHIYSNLETKADIFYDSDLNYDDLVERKIFDLRKTNIKEYI